MGQDLYRRSAAVHEFGAAVGALGARTALTVADAARLAGVVVAAGLVQAPNLPSVGRVSSRHALAARGSLLGSCPI